MDEEYYSCSDSGGEYEDMYNITEKSDAGDTAFNANKMYQVIEPKQLIQQLNKFIEEASSLIGLPVGVASVVLAKFDWNKEKLYNQYEELEWVLDELLTSCKVLQLSDTTNYGEEDCQVCFCPEQLVSISCSHKYCGDCWESHLKSNIEELNWQVKCIEPSCGCILTEEIVRLLIKDDKLFERYKQLTAEAFVQINDSFKMCSGTDCGCVIQINDPDFLGVQCKCGKSFCVGCDAETDHNPITCKRLDDWFECAKVHNDEKIQAIRKHLTEDNETQRLLNRLTKKCPKCKAPIEKSGGCNYMRCGKCQHPFCWICMTHTDHQHHACNAYVDNQANQVNTMTEEQKKMIAEAEAYKHYSQRFVAHQESLKLEEKLQQRVKEKADQLKEIFLYTTAQVKFLEDAISTLAECRKTLMYSYPFAFFIQANPQKMIFEDNQKHLEQQVEALSGLLENQFEFEQAATVSWKSHVIDKTKHVAKQRGILLEHVFDGNRKNQWAYKN